MDNWAIFDTPGFEQEDVHFRQVSSICQTSDSKRNALIVTQKIFPLFVFPNDRPGNV